MCLVTWVTCSVCDSLRVCGGRCHTAWRSPPASGSGSRRCRPGRFRSSNLLTEHFQVSLGGFSTSNQISHFNNVLPRQSKPSPVSCRARQPLRNGLVGRSGTPNTQGVQEPPNALGKCYRSQLGHLTPPAHKNQLLLVDFKTQTSFHKPEHLI